MTRHQRLQRNMRNPARQARRRKNRAHRLARQAVLAMMLDETMMELNRRHRSLMEYERIGMLVHRPSPIVVTGF